MYICWKFKNITVLLVLNIKNTPPQIRCKHCLSNIVYRQRNFMLAYIAGGHLYKCICQLVCPCIEKKYAVARKLGNKFGKQMAFKLNHTFYAHQMLHKHVYIHMYTYIYDIIVLHFHFPPVKCGLLSQPVMRAYQNNLRNVKNVAV